MSFSLWSFAFLSFQTYYTFCLPFPRVLYVLNISLFPYFHLFIILHLFSFLIHHAILLYPSFLSSSFLPFFLPCESSLSSPVLFYHALLFSSISPCLHCSTPFFQPFILVFCRELPACFPSPSLPPSPAVLSVAPFLFSNILSSTTPFSLSISCSLTAFFFLPFFSPSPSLSFH